MPTHPHDDVLRRVAAETVESLALMFLMSEKEAKSPGSCAARAAVNFSGPFSGVLVLAASDAVLPALAANMLGLEDGEKPSSAQQEDALGELCNVVCGNVLPAIAGDTPVFHVSAPRRLEAPEVADLERNRTLAGSARICAEAGAVEVALLVDGPCPVPA